MHTHPTCQKWQSVLGTFLCSLYFLLNSAACHPNQHFLFSLNQWRVCHICSYSIFLHSSLAIRSIKSSSTFYFERLIKVEKFHWMPLKFQKLDRRDFSESECFSSPHSLKYNCFTLLWDGWRYQNGWVFGKSSKGGRGVIYNPKNYIEDLCTAIFRKKCKISFRKLGGNKGRLDFHPFWYQHPSLICKL